MKCQQCGSEHTRTFSVVFEEGTTHGNSSGHVDGYATSANSFNQTPLAAKCSPPELQRTGGFVQFLGFVLAIYLAVKLNGITWSSKFSELTGWPFVLSFLGIGLAFMVTWELLVSGPREARYKMAMDRWRQSWVCLRCGTTQEAPPPGVANPVG